MDARHAQHSVDERRHIEAFRDGLPGVARALAHISSLTVFDGYGIIDDWNLSARWELTVYDHPFSRWIIGNALLAYLFCQSWGNDPQYCGEWLAPVVALVEGAAADDRLPCAKQDRLLDALLDFQHWHYRLPGSPTLIVPDTRTRCWRSERNLGRPSGLMDWEILSELQQDLFGEKAAIIVSPAPMFGVKLIEDVQKLFSWIDQSLLVDAENWMVHRGAALVMVNISHHSHTLGNYLILPGDAHCPFVYDIQIYRHEHGPRLWQIVSSGIKNESPRRLLDWFDRLNYWLYTPWSPLSWLTQRRSLEICPRVPQHSQAGERLWNSAEIGRVFIGEDGHPRVMLQVNADGSPATAFE